jgi:hypothetical protein
MPCDLVSETGGKTTLEINKMDNQLKIKLTIKFETTYLFDYFKHEKISTSSF